MTRTRVYGWLGDHTGCGYYRIRLPLDTLPDDRWDVSYSTILPDTWRDDADVIIGQRVCKPGPSQLWREICRHRRVTAVYEVDDDLLNIDHTSDIAWSLYSQPEMRENLKRNAAAADLVTVTTEPLAAVMREYNPNVVVVPNYIPAFLLGVERPHDGLPVVVGYTSSATHDMDYATVHNQLRRFLGRHPNTLVHFIGSSYAGLPPNRVLWTQFITPVPTYLRFLINLDIGIAPLRPHLFNRSKSHIKALEYAAVGVPAVVSAEPPYETFVRHGETGVLVRRDHEWASLLGQLAMDETLRTNMGQKARAHAAAWTIEGNIGRWEAALTGKATS